MCKYTVHEDDVQWDVVKENWDKLSIKEKDRQAWLPYCMAGCQHVPYAVWHVSDMLHGIHILYIMSRQRTCVRLQPNPVQQLMHLS